MGSRPGLRSMKNTKRWKSKETLKNTGRNTTNTGGLTGGETEQMNWQRISEKNTNLTRQRLINK